MAYTIVKKSTDYFNTKTWTGTGSSNALTGLGFQPDMVWNKIRNSSGSHRLTDAVRGVTKEIYPDLSETEDTQAQGVTAFGTDGFTVGTNAGYNASGSTYASWNWKGGTTSGITTNGSTTITPSAYSFSQTAGISIVKYTGNATAGAKVAHGLGAVPALIFVKVLDANNNWAVYHKEMGETKAMYLDSNHAETTDGWLNDTAPDNVNFTLSGGNYGNTANTHIAYCFAETTGFSKFGKFTGNGDLDGPFCYTGFKPAFVIIKNTITSSDWNIYDNRRSTSGGYNVVDYTIVANSNAAEDTATTYNDIDILSNGFKIREDNGDCNGTGQKMIYIAFAAEPLVGDNPATAR